MKRIFPFFLPFYYFEVEVDAELAVVKDRIKKNTQPAAWRGTATDPKIFEGIVKGDEFFVKIPPYISHKLEFFATPVITGKLTRKHSNTNVAIFMRMPLGGLFTVLFFAYFICLSFYPFASEAIQGLPHKYPVFSESISGFLILPIFFISSFWVAAFFAERELNKILLPSPKGF